MNDPKWLTGAILLGTVFFIAIFIIKPVGVSTQFSVLSGIIHSTVNPNIITSDPDRDSGYKSTNEYYDKSDGLLAKNIKNPWNYDFVFVLAIPLGAYLGYLLNRKHKQSAMSDVGQQASGLPQKKQGFLRHTFPSFLGGFLILFAARMADGCTSGHMMSGIMQGSVSGYIFAAAAFAVAIPTAILVGKRNDNGGTQ